MTASLPRIKSPCLTICQVDPRFRQCVGCGRTIKEISEWARLTDADRERIMAELPDRIDAMLPYRDLAD